MAMIEVKNLTKRYRDRIAIDGLNFSVNEGEILGFLGPNGAGKTTTMRILTGFLPASAGSAKIGGVGRVEQPVGRERRPRSPPVTPPPSSPMTAWGGHQFVA